MSRGKGVEDAADLDPLVKEAVALMLGAEPAFDPDTVKARLMRSARTIEGDPTAVGTEWSAAYLWSNAVNDVEPLTSFTPGGLDLNDDP